MVSFIIEQKDKNNLQKALNKFSHVYLLLNQQHQSDLEEIHRFVRISSIGASTRIENALLTDNEINWIDTILSTAGVTTAFHENKDIIIDKLSKDRERSIEEVAGCRRMLYLIYEQAEDFIELKEKDIRGLHYELLAEYNKVGIEKGHYKSLPNYVVEKNSIGQEVRKVFKTADPGIVTEVAMQELLEWYKVSRSTPGMTIAVASEFVYRFLSIHPFQDGNGRLGRGLFLLSLLQSEDVVIRAVAKYLALDRHIEKAKEEYYIVLNKVSGGVFKQNPSDYKIEYFFRFMLRIIDAALDDIEFYITKLGSLKEISDSARIVYKCFKEHPEIRMNTQQIVSDTKLPRRTVTYALSMLVSKKLLQKYGRGASVKYQLTF